jgi:hypothetical protein
LIAAFIVFCLVYGLAFPVLFPYIIVPIVAPPVMLLGLVIWALPDTGSPPTGSLNVLFFVFIVCLIAWPNYVALALPGVPWITMARLTGAPLSLLLLICFSTSKSFRSDVAKPLHQFAIIRNLFLIFVALEFFSVIFSKNKGLSLGRLIAAQFNWTAIFLASVYVFAKPGRAERMAKVMWALAIFVGLIGLVEWRLQHVIWAGHIPSFLKVEDQSVAQALAGEHRLGGKYRVISTFSTSLGLGEYMALTMPFVMHFAFGAYGRVLKIFARATIPFILFITYISGSRLGLIGCLLTLVFYGGVWAVLNWRRNPGSLLAPALLIAVPATLPLGVAAIFSIGRLRHIVWGTGAQAYSDQARGGQLTLGIPLILKHPWGYGIGMGGQALGFSPFGFLTIDNYFLSIALEYGVIGFVVYYGMFLTAIYQAGMRVLGEPFRERELGLLTATAIALTNFVLIKAVFSQEANHPITFMILGMTIALLYRARVSQAIPVAAAPRGTHISAQTRTGLRDLAGAAR